MSGGAACESSRTSGREHRSAGRRPSCAGWAVSGDAALVAAARTDRRVRPWDARTGVQLARLAVPTPLRWVVSHSSRALLGFGGGGGHAHLAELVRISYAPLVATAHGTPASAEDG
jgi:hypothetical protein